MNGRAPRITVFGRGSVRWAAPTLVFVSGLTSCGGCEDRSPVDDTFDGNVLIGDASSSSDRGPNTLGDASAVGDASDAALRDEDGSIPRTDAGRIDGGDAGNACAPLPMHTLSAATAIARRAELVGFVIEIVGTVTSSGLVCDRCDGGACDCACRAQLSIDDLLPLAPSECFDDPGCRGTTCTQVCRPPLLGAPQRFLGRLRAEKGDTVLELLSVSP